MRVEQVFERHPHGDIDLLIRVVPVLVIVTDQQQHSQAHSLRCVFIKSHPAIVFGDSLRLKEE